MEIYGHAQQWERLQSLANRDSVSLLLIGKEGIGKKALALSFLHRLLRCAPNADVLEHPDLMLIAPENNRIPIDRIREAISFSGMKSYEEGRRVILIDDAHAMGAEAQNALLKLLEEPPCQQWIFLVTEKPQMLLATVRSRLLSLSFSPLSRDTLERITRSKVGEELAELTEGSLSQLEAYRRADMDQLSAFARAYIGDEATMPSLRKEETSETFALCGAYTAKVLRGMLAIALGGQTAISESRACMRHHPMCIRTIYRKLAVLERGIAEGFGSYNKKLLVPAMQIEGRLCHDEHRRRSL